MDEIPERKYYEGVSGGWWDGRLGQACDLIYSVIKDRGERKEDVKALYKAMSAVEAADDEVREASHD